MEDQRVGSAATLGRLVSTTVMPMAVDVGVDEDVWAAIAL